MTPTAAGGAVAASQTVVLLVPLDPADGPRAAWGVARATAPDRQAALIDLSGGEPVLDAGADRTGPEGIGDVLAFGASWGLVARQQAAAHLHYVPAGTPPADPRELWGHPRWERLRHGFRAARALLLLYAPAPALADLGPRADVLVMLGLGADEARVRAYAAGRDLPVLGPVLAPAESPTDVVPGPATAPSRGAGWLPWLLGAAVALTVFLAVTLFAR